MICWRDISVYAPSEAPGEIRSVETFIDPFKITIGRNIHYPGYWTLYCEVGSIFRAFCVLRSKTLDEAKNEVLGIIEKSSVETLLQLTATPR